MAFVALSWVDYSFILPPADHNTRYLKYNPAFVYF